MGKRISRNLIILLNLFGRLLLFKDSMVFDVRRKKKVARNFPIAISSSYPIQIGNEGLHLLNSNMVHVNKQKFMMTPSKTFFDSFSTPLVWSVQVSCQYL